MATIQKKNIVGLKELRKNMESYIKRVHNGESITVFRRSTPLFKLTPIAEDESQWETVVDFTKINKRGVPVEKVLAALKKIDG